MKTMWIMVAAWGAVLATGTASAVMIDDFEAGAFNGTVSNSFPLWGATQSAPSILGGQRHVTLTSDVEEGQGSLHGVLSPSPGDDAVALTFTGTGALAKAYFDTTG